MKLSNLKLTQIDQTLNHFQRTHFPPKPAGGWIRAIREALGMTASALADRVALSRPAINKFERSEIQDSITLASLRKLAAALDCELHYAFVPRTTLAQQLRDQAIKVAKLRLAPIAHSMSLEAQSVQGQARTQQIQLQAEELLQGSRRALWKL